MIRSRKRRVPFGQPRLLAMACVVALAILLAAAGSESSFRLDGLPADSGTFTPDDLSVGQVIVVVWRPSSPACRDIVPRVNRLVANWGERARVVTVVAVSIDPEHDTPARVQEFLGGTASLKAPIYLDTSGSFSKQYSVDEQPGLLVFNEGELGFRGKLPVNPDPVIERTLG